MELGTRYGFSVDTWTSQGRDIYFVIYYQLCQTFLLARLSQLIDHFGGTVF